MIQLTQKTKDAIWCLVISVDYNYSRITIPEHKICADKPTPWLEDKHDIKEIKDQCLHLDICLEQYAGMIRDDNLNSYESAKMHPKGTFMYKTGIEITEPIRWYTDDASMIEQRWASEALLKNVLTEYLMSEIRSQKKKDFRLLT